MWVVEWLWWRHAWLDQHSLLLFYSVCEFEVNIKEDAFLGFPSSINRKLVSYKEIGWSRTSFIYFCLLLNSYFSFTVCFCFQFNYFLNSAYLFVVWFTSIGIQSTVMDNFFPYPQSTMPPNPQSKYTVSSMKNFSPYLKPLRIECEKASKKQNEELAQQVQAQEPEKEVYRMTRKLKRTSRFDSSDSEQKNKESSPFQFFFWDMY